MYQACWSPHDASVLVSVSADRSVRLWDERSPGGSIKVVAGAHDNEVLCVDWNKWDAVQLATGSVDLGVRVWDLRMMGRTGAQHPVHRLSGHRRAVRRVKWSPFTPTALLSTSYDMSLRAWELTSLNPLAGSWEGHTEFVTGLDVSLHDREGGGLVATCGWDQTIHLLRPGHWGQLPSRPVV